MNICSSLLSCDIACFRLTGKRLPCDILFIIKEHLSNYKSTKKALRVELETDIIPKGAQKKNMNNKTKHLVTKYRMKHACRWNR